MLSQRVFVTQRCNQNCVFCTFRRAVDDPRAIARTTLENAIDDAAMAGVQTLVLTGGEPTLRRDLVDLVAQAKRREIASVVLETNATTIDDAAATRLASAGLGVARVHLSMASADLDIISRDPGGYEASVAGLLALRAAGIPIEIVVTVVRATAATLPALPPRLRALLGDDLRRLVVVVPVESPVEEELLTYEEAATAIAGLDDACRAIGVPLQLAEDSGPPPCAFPARDRRHHLHALTPGAQRQGTTQLEGCAACVARDRCPGMADAYLARHPTTTVRPVVDRLSRRRLTVVGSVAQQVARELAQPSHPAGGMPEMLVRVMFHCNQACDFCFVSTHLPTPADSAVRGAIEGAAAQGKRVILSGGEPTLNPRLVEYVRLAHASAAGRWPVEIQTNAVSLDDSTRVDALVHAGLEDAFVSLHGSTAEVSDLVTQAPGTHARTLVGIDNLVRAGVRVVVNFVICTANQHDLAATVALVGTRWRGVSLNLSFVAPSTDLVPRETWLIPRYRDVLPAIETALVRAEELGVPVVGFESMCGLPLCLVPPRVAALMTARRVEAGDDPGEFVYAETCGGCAASSHCWGLRRGYAAMYGTSELEALAPEARGARRDLS